VRSGQSLLQALLEVGLSHPLCEKGSVVILKNNAPKYVIISYDQIAADEQVSDEQLIAVSRKSFKRHEAAYKELAK
jgi:antitoxin Phd